MRTAGTRRSIARRGAHAVAALLALAIAGCGDDPPRTYVTAPYINKGNVADCSTFESQAHAQAVLRADPTDRNGLDIDLDGIACPDLPGPKDDDAVERAIITDKDGAPIDPDYESSKQERRERSSR